MLLQDRHFFDRLLSLKVWLPLCLIIIVLCILGNVFYGRYFTFQGYTWQYIAVLTYVGFFIFQYYFYSRKYSKLLSFALSFFACYFTSLIYEMPFFLMQDSTFHFVIFYLNLIPYVYLLKDINYKPTRKLLPSLIILSLWYLFCFYNPNWNVPFWKYYYFIPRLTPFPLFISILKESL